MLREDYLERMIRQLAQALARILGLRQRGETEAALEELEAAMASVAGLDPRAVEASDPAVLATLLRDPARLAALGRLFAERAALEDDRGDGRPSPGGMRSPPGPWAGEPPGCAAGPCPEASRGRGTLLGLARVG